MTDLKTLDGLLKNKKGFPKEFRLYYILNGIHFYANNGKVQDGFVGINVIGDSIQRDQILSIYDKMEFFFDELIRLMLVGFNDDEKSRKLLYILSIVPVNRKIRLFLDWKIFGKEFTQKLSRLFEVKNDTIHCVRIEEITYRTNKPLKFSKKGNQEQFKNDLKSSFDELLTIYDKQIKKLPMKKATEVIKKYQYGKKVI